MLRKVIRPDKSSVSFKYDSLGRRIEKTVTKAGSEEGKSEEAERQTTIQKEAAWEKVGGVRIRRPNAETKKTHELQGNNQTIYEEESSNFNLCQIKENKVEKVIRFLWDGNILLHEWEQADTTKRLKAKHKVDCKADFVQKLEEKEEQKSTEKAENGKIPPDSLITWIFQDDFIPRAKITRDGTYSIISDYLGTPVEAYDENGNKVWERELDIYGRVKRGKKDIYGRNEKETGERNFIPFRFQGQYEDEEIGLYYNRFRYYDPQQGQYTQQDPIGIAGGNPTLYGYVFNTLGEIDSLGLATRPNNGLFNSFFEFTLEEINWLSSDAVQFNRANKAFINRMKVDPIFRKDMLRRYPELVDWLKKPRMSGSPAGLTWHHNPDVSGKLQLVDCWDHNKNHGLYHQDGKGGRENWGGGKNCR